MRACKSGLLLMLLLPLTSAGPLMAAETLDQLIAGAQTFGGTKNLSVLEAAFNKRFGLNAKIRFAAGPEMNAMAARVITELKSGTKRQPISTTAPNPISRCSIERKHWSGSTGPVFFPGSRNRWRFFLRKGCWFLHRSAA